MALHDTHHYFNYIAVIDTLYFVGKQGKSQSVTQKVKVLLPRMRLVYIKLQNIYLMIVYY